MSAAVNGRAIGLKLMYDQGSFALQRIDVIMAVLKGQAGRVIEKTDGKVTRGSITTQKLPFQKNSPNP